MTDTDVIPGIAAVPVAVSADLDVVQWFVDTARRTAVSERTHVTAEIAVHCPSMEAVDCAAAQWGVPARWSEDRTQYRAQVGNYRLRLVAVWIPLKAVVPPDEAAWPPAAQAAEHALATMADVDKAAAQWAAQGRQVTTGWEGDARYAARTVDADGNVECAFWRFAA